MPGTTEIATTQPLWTYIDVMATALAYVEAEKLDADSERWNAAWEKIIQSNVAADLLDGVFFSTRTPYQALSDQVEALIRTLSRAGILSLGNPRYALFTMTKESKEAIRSQNKRLIEERGADLQKMAEVLSSNLAAK